MQNQPKPTEITRYKFNVHQFKKMAEVGILPRQGTEELLDGAVLDPSPLVRNRCHPDLKGGVTRFLNELAGIPAEMDDRIHKYTVAEYHVMGEAGILTQNDRVELIDGEIVQMPPIGSSHQETVDVLTELFVSLVSGEARVRVQGPVRLGERGEPEPDLLLLRRREGFYRSAHPQPNDVFLAVEVSETTLRYDRNVKVPLYAQQGIPEVWLVNLPAETVEVYRDPQGAAYRETNQYRRGDTLSPQAFPNLQLAVEQMLG